MRTFGPALALTAMALFACSCGPRGGTDVGNGFNVKLNLRAFEPPTPQPAGVKLSSGVMIDSLFMTTSRFRMQPGTDCTKADPNVDIAGPLVANLAGEGFLGGEPEFSVASTKFCELRLDFDKIDGAALPDGAPPELAGLSILVEGHRADGTPFVVRSAMNGEFRISANDGAFTLPANDQALIVGFDVAEAMSALQLDSLSGNPIVIDGSTNADRLKDFEDAVKTSASLFRDENDDGDLSPSESDAQKELGHGDL